MLNFGSDYFWSYVKKYLKTHAYWVRIITVFLRNICYGQSLDLAPRDFLPVSALHVALISTGKLTIMLLLVFIPSKAAMLLPWGMLKLKCSSFYEIKLESKYDKWLTYINLSSCIVLQHIDTDKLFNLYYKVSCYIMENCNVI
jgi:hypothetical protein